MPAIRVHSLFTPRYLVIKGTRYGCDAAGNACGDFCETDGKNAYCLIPDSLGVTGKDVLNEDVRQYCIWKQENNTFSKNG